MEKILIKEQGKKRLVRDFFYLLFKIIFGINFLCYNQKVSRGVSPLPFSILSCTCYYFTKDQKIFKIELEDGFFEERKRSLQISYLKRVRCGKEFT